LQSNFRDFIPDILRILGDNFLDEFREWCLNENSEKLDKINNWLLPEMKASRAGLNY